MAYVGYWFASLYVVVEGWRAIGLSDERVDGLLSSPNVCSSIRAPIRVWLNGPRISCGDLLSLAQSYVPQNSTPGVIERCGAIAFSGPAS
jgi:hypothetical protein